MTDDEWAGDDAGSSADAAAADSDGDRSGAPREKRTGVDVETVVTYGQWGAVLALGILAVVAAAGLYGSLSAIIDVWIADRYQPFARAIFNFGVLCVAAAGIVVLVRRQ